MPLFAPWAVDFVVVLAASTAGGYRDVLQVADASIRAFHTVFTGGRYPFVPLTHFGGVEVVEVILCHIGRLIGPPADHDADLGGRGSVFPRSKKYAGVT